MEGMERRKKDPETPKRRLGNIIRAAALAATAATSFNPNHDPGYNRVARTMNSPTLSAGPIVPPVRVEDLIRDPNQRPKEKQKRPDPETA